MDARKTPLLKAVEATAPTDVCALAIHKMFLTQEEIILAYTSMCCLLLPRNREDTWDPSASFLKGLLKHKSPQVKHRTKINIKNEIQYESEVDDDLADSSYHQMQGNDNEEKGADYQHVATLNQNKTLW